MTLLATTLVLALAPWLLAAAAAAFSAQPSDAPRGPGASAVARMAGYAASLLLALWALSVADRPAGELLAGLAPPELGETLAVGLGLAAVLGLLALGVHRGGAFLLRWAYRVSGRAVARGPSSTAVVASDGRFPAWAALVIAVCAAIYEELVWRGLLQAGLSARIGVPAAVVAVSLAFAALHARQGPVATVFSAVAALLLGAAFAWRGDLAGVVLAHAAYNASAVAVDRWGPPAARRAAARAVGNRFFVSTPG